MKLALTITALALLIGAPSLAAAPPTAQPTVRPLILPCEVTPLPKVYHNWESAVEAAKNNRQKIVAWLWAEEDHQYYETEQTSINRACLDAHVLAYERSTLVCYCGYRNTPGMRLEVGRGPAVVLYDPAAATAVRFNFPMSPDDFLSTLKQL